MQSFTLNTEMEVVNLNHSERSHMPHCSQQCNHASQTDKAAFLSHIQPVQLMTTAATIVPTYSTCQPVSINHCATYTVSDNDNKKFVERKQSQSLQCITESLTVSNVQISNSLHSARSVERYNRVIHLSSVESHSASVNWQYIAQLCDSEICQRVKVIPVQLLTFKCLRSMEHHVTFVGCPLKRPAELCVQLLAAETILIHMLMFMLMSS